MRDDPRPFVIGPLGEALTIDALPDPEAERWIARRKAEVVVAIEGGLLTLEEAGARYGITMEELTTWRRDMNRMGMAGLQTTRAKAFRDRYRREQ